MTGSRFTQGVAFTIMLLGVCGRAGAQQAEAASARSAVSAAPTADNAPEEGSLPVSLNRIRAGLSKTSVLVLDHQPVFRSGVVEYRPRGFDLPSLFTTSKAAPTWQNTWHDQFINMVTPPEFRQWQAFSGTDLLQVAVTSAAQALGARGLRAVSGALHDAREAAARQEVDAALAQYLRP